MRQPQSLTSSIVLRVRGRPYDLEKALHHSTCQQGHSKIFRSPDKVSPWAILPMERGSPPKQRPCHEYWCPFSKPKRPPQDAILVSPLVPLPPVTILGWVAGFLLALPLPFSLERSCAAHMFLALGGGALMSNSRLLTRWDETGF